MSGREGMDVDVVVRGPRTRKLTSTAVCQMQAVCVSLRTYNYYVRTYRSLHAAADRHVHVDVATRSYVA